MPLSRRDLFKLTSTAAAGVAVAGLGTRTAQAQDSAAALVAADPLLHLLNRVTWGTRPEDLAYAQQIGYEAYLDEQLHPEALPDPEGDAVVAGLPILALDRNNLYRLNESERLRNSLVAGVVLRAAHSRRQLLERMVDFWADHFNVYDPENTAEVIAYQRDALRPHALGSFRSLVLATAKAPAMLDYLDNNVNIAEDPNENYARELMELHTLGVDGGYTEGDVQEVARAFTGWTINNGTRDGFWFDADMHDTGTKTVLGHRLPAGRGMEDGLHVINILAKHPATAQFLSRKLCTRFVSDNPPQSLVDSTAAVWRETDGEIRPVLRHIFTSLAFMTATGQKFRRPLEYFVGLLRATRGRYANPEQYVSALVLLNQVPYEWAPPNGYPDVAGAWLNTGGLLQRWNVASDIMADATSTTPSIELDLYSGTENTTTAGDLVQAVAYRIFAARLAAQQAAPFIDYVADGGDAATPLTTSMRARKLGTLYSLMLAAPLYQWR